MASNGPKIGSQNYRTQACCITFEASDKLALTNFPPELYSRFQEMVSSSWHKGIQRLVVETKLPNSYNVQLRGNPWFTGGFELSADSQTKISGVTNTARLLLGLTRFMASEGWAMEVSMTVETGSYGFLRPHSTWIFTEGKEMSKSSDLRPAMCCIAFGQVDKISIVDGRPEVLDAMQSSIEQFWPKGVQERNSYEETEEFKLRGRPWGYDSFQGSILLAQLVLALKNVGWRTYGTVEFRYTSGGNGAHAIHSVRRWILKKCAVGVTDSWQLEDASLHPQGF